MQLVVAKGSTPRVHRGRDRLLLLCDYHPGLLDSLSKTLNSVGLNERVLVRKRGRAEWRDERTQVINLALRVFGEEEALRISSIVSLLAYVILATAMGLLVVVKRRLDTIIGIFAFPQGLVAVLIAALTGRKAIVLTDGGDIDIMLANSSIRALILAFLRKASTITALNSTKRRKLRSLGIESQFCPIFGVDTSCFRYVTYEDKEDRLILYVGRLSNEKRPEVLLEACNRARREGFSFKLLILGDGPLRNQIADAIVRMGMTDIVTLEGYVPHSQIYQFFQRGAIFVLPSIREGVSVSLLEAMSSGCLCIVSDIPDNQEIIRHMRNGILFRPDDVEDLADKLRWANSNPSKVAIITRRARQTIQQNYSLQAVGETIAALLVTGEH